MVSFFFVACLQIVDILMSTDHAFYYFFIIIDYFFGTQKMLKKYTFTENVQPLRFAKEKAPAQKEKYIVQSHTTHL